MSLKPPGLKIFLVFTALAMIFMLAGCSQDRDQAPSGDAGLKVYRHSMDQAPTSLDPAQAANVYANFVVLNAYDTLFSYKYLARPYVLKTNLAADWPDISADGLTYTIRIKPGVRFVDDPAFEDGRGHELVAEDFVYSIRRQFDPATRPQGAWLWAWRIAGLDAWKEAGSDYSAAIDGLKAVDAHTIVIRLIRPYPQLLNTLALGFSSIVPREAVEYYGKEFAVHPVGSGPFRVVSYDTSKVVLEKNSDFRQEPVDLKFEGFDPASQAATGVEKIDGRSPPFIDRLEISFIKETSARWN